MTKEQLKSIVAKKVQGQGTNIDAANVLPTLFNEILDMIPEEQEGALIVQASTSTTVKGYQVPNLTADQVTQAYNAVIGGRGCYILDKDELGQFAVNQADVLSEEPSIGILFYSYLLITYSVEGNNVTIVGYPLPTETTVLKTTSTVATLKAAHDAIAASKLNGKNYAIEVDDDTTLFYPVSCNHEEGVGATLTFYDGTAYKVVTITSEGVMTIV